MIGTRHARSVLLAGIGLCACLAISAQSRAGAPPEIGNATLRDARGQATSVTALAQAHKLTVVIFYAASCPCFAAHVERLRQLEAAARPPGSGIRRGRL